MAFGSQPKSPDTRTREELLDFIYELQSDNARLTSRLETKEDRLIIATQEIKEATRAYKLACLSVIHLGKLGRGEHSIHRCRPMRRVRHPVAS